MLFRRLLFAAVIVLLPGSVHAVHFGEALPPNEHPTVGQILLVDDQGAALTYGTGTLIAPDIVLTAAHVVVPAKSPFHIVFQMDSLPDDSFRGLAYRIHPDYYNLRGTSTSNRSMQLAAIASDVAVVRLLRPVAGIETFYSIAGNAPPAGVKATVIGYGKNEKKEGGVRRIGSLRFTAPHRDYLLFSAGSDRFQRTDFGDSGGPVLFQAGDRTQIIALVQGGSVLSEFKHLVSDEYGHYVSMSQHAGWVERATSELNAIPAGLDEYVYILRRETDAEMPACSGVQLAALADIGTPMTRLLSRMIVRGASDPVPAPILKACLEAGLPKESLFVSVRKPTNANSESTK
jgi:hypothetical protein